MIDPIILVDWVKLSDKDPDAGDHVKEDHEDKAEEDETLRAHTYLKHLRQILDELIPDLDDLEHAHHFSHPDNLIELSYAAEPSYLIVTACQEYQVKGYYRYEIYEEPGLQIALCDFLCSISTEGR